MKSTKDNKVLFIGIFSLCWLLVVFVGYGYIHKPFLPEELIGVMNVFWRTLTALIILSLGGGIGLSIRGGRKELDPLTQAVLDSALGIGIMSILMLLISATVGINYSIWILLITGLILFRKKILLWGESFTNINIFWQETGSVGRLAIFIMCIILISQYLHALAPPTGFDALTYHLALPKAYLQAEHLTYIQNNVFWGMPQLVELLYTLAMYLGGPEAAPVLGWWMGMLALIGLGAFSKSVFDGDAGWISMAGLMAGSGLTTSLSSGYVEWPSMLFGVSVFICFSQWLMDEQTWALVMAGSFAGMGFGTKYTNGIILVAGSIIILFLVKYTSYKKLLANILMFGGAALLFILPWCFKNLFATSNPFYPLFIPSGGMDSILLTFYQFKPFAQDWSRFLLLPWQATIWGADGGEGFSSSIGPLLIGLMPFSIIYMRNTEPIQKATPSLKTACVILLTGFLAWAFGSQFRGLLIQTRLYFIIFPAWGFLAAAGYSAIAKIKSHNIRFGKLTETFIILALLFNFFYTIKETSQANPIPVILNMESRQSYLGRNLGGYTTAMNILQSLPGSSKTLMLWETRAFECEPNCDPDEIIGRWFHDWTKYQNSELIVAEWRAQGYTHVLLNRNGADFVRLYDVNSPKVEYWDGLATTLKTLIPTEKINGGYELYQIP